MESWLVLSSMVLIGLASIYSQLRHAQAGARILVEVLLLLLLSSSLLAAAAYLITQWKAMRQALTTIDLSSVLLAADAKIDEPLIKELGRGTIRLLRCNWLLTTDIKKLQRQQDLPPEAFVSPTQASRMVRRGDRSVLALSYGWFTPIHPECVQ